LTVNYFNFIKTIFAINHENMQNDKIFQSKESQKLKIVLILFVDDFLNYYLLFPFFRCRLLNLFSFFRFLWYERIFLWVRNWGFTLLSFTFVNIRNWVYWYILFIKRLRNFKLLKLFLIIFINLLLFFFVLFYIHIYFRFCYDLLLIIRCLTYMRFSLYILFDWFLIKIIEVCLFLFERYFLFSG